MIPRADRVLMQLHWVDCTNVAGGWHDDEALDDFAADGAWEASNTGWLVYEDDMYYVLAGRMTDDGKNVGLIERIPKAAVTAATLISAQAATLPVMTTPPLQPWTVTVQAGHVATEFSVPASTVAADPDLTDYLVFSDASGNVAGRFKRITVLAIVAASAPA